MKHENYVAVVDKHGKPLMPTKNHCKVRHLLDEGKAVAIGDNPLTIRLKYDVPGYTQPMHEGIDTGRENIGDAISTDKGENVYLADIKTNNKSIKKNMEDRADFRRQRRRHDRQSKQRKAKHDKTEMEKGEDDIRWNNQPCKSKEVKYPGADNPVTHKSIQGKEGKFNNRKRPKGWITPSARQVVQITMNEVKQTAKIFPITHISLERVSFDFQKLENENIRAWEYGKGPLYGFKSYKDYIREEQHDKCLICGQKKIDYFHHINPQKNGKYDHVSNIAGLCHDCHYGPNGVHNDQETADLLEDLKAAAKQKYQVGLLNSVMPMLIDEMTAYCEEKGVELTITNGKTTSETRKKYGLKKDHCVDAYAISLADRKVDVENVNLSDKIYMKRRFKKKSKNITATRNQRVYKLNGKIVAYNRHKATDQKEDSLKEFLTKYRKNHSEKELNQMMHRIQILPAKRTYTYHKSDLIAPLHPGDIVRYEKKNKIKGNTKIETFIATGVEYTEVTRSKKGYKWREREWKVEFGDGNKIRKVKFCRRLQSGCVQTIGSENVDEYLAKIS